MTPIKDAWDKFNRMVVPRIAGATQRDETRKAFYAGASLCFKIVTNGVSEGEEIRPEDLELLHDIAAEVNAFDAEVLSRLSIKAQA